MLAENSKNYHMKVFISWSGERSRRIAELLDNWIQCVIQAVDPWMSSKDIDRGALWFTEISDQLSTTTVGIVCLTKENKNKPWILFESGALAKGLSSNRVCTFLIDLIPTDLENPLAQFNHTLPNRDSLWELVRTINLTLKERALKESVLEKVFTTYWPQFEGDFANVLEATPEGPGIAKRDDNDVMLEVLSTVRMLERKLRAVESFTPSNTNLSRARLKNTVMKLFLKQISEPEIIDTLQAMGYPAAVAAQELAFIKKTRNEQEDINTSEMTVA